MAFKYSCFISYRHGKGRLLKRIAFELEEALSSELEAVTELPLYIDKTIEGGDLYNPILATALCESVCMIVAYTSIYFSSTNTYCAREYKAMEKLEAERLGLLGLPADTTHGLIIPVVFRGAEDLPKELKSKRHYYNFGNFLLRNPSRKLGDQYPEEISQMAQYIANRCKIVEQLPSQQLSDCANFALPTSDEVINWVRTVEDKGIPFPV